MREITATGREKDFLQVIRLIKDAKDRAMLSVNTELIGLYWNIGAYISSKIKTALWGEGVVDELAMFISKNMPELKGFSNKNMWRMKQFYEIYRDRPKLSPLVRQLSWTNNMMILSKTKSPEEREFYINLSIKERYSKRELERQIDSGVYERHMLSKLAAVPRESTKVTAVRTQLADSFKDTYILDFLNLPKNYSEKDLQAGLIENFKNFLLEFGKDLAFVGQEYRISVGNNDYYIDLLFYHRDLRCLVVFELKIDDFKPEYLGKLNFYLEALDRDVRKKHENPSVGVILCKTRDSEVVKYSLSRNMSPALIATYKIKLIPKRILMRKLRELYENQRDGTF